MFLLRLASQDKNAMCGKIVTPQEDGLKFELFVDFLLITEEHLAAQRDRGINWNPVVHPVSRITIAPVDHCAATPGRLSHSNFQAVPVPSAAGI